jgi:alpha-L-fucosidase
VIRELSKACKEYGLKLGIYLSPWDRNSAVYGKPEYITYYRNQLRELLSEYGDIFEVWFDGANGGDGYYGGARETRKIDNRTYYDWPNTWNVVRDLQNGAVMFSDAGPDVRWVGNESGLGSPTNWSLLKREEMYPGGDFASILGAGHEDGNYWVPAEVDVSIRPGWFYHAQQDSQVKSPEKLMELYYASVGRNCNLLLNVPPDRRGLLNENDVRTLIDFKGLRDKEFAVDLARNKKAKTSATRGKRFLPSFANDGDPGTYWATPDNVMSASLTIDLGAETEVNRVLIQEYIRLGQRVQKYSVQALVRNEWKTVVDGTTIGYKVIRKFPVIKTSVVKINIERSKSCPAISNVELFRAPGN